MMITTVGRGVARAVNTIPFIIGRDTGRRIRHERTITIGRVTGRRIRHERTIIIGRVTGRRIRHERTIIVGRVTGRRIRRPYRPWNRSLFQFAGLLAIYCAIRSCPAPSRMMDS